MVAAAGRPGGEARQRSCTHSSVSSSTTTCGARAVALCLHKHPWVHGAAHGAAAAVLQARHLRRSRRNHTTMDNHPCVHGAQHRHPSTPSSSAAARSARLHAARRRGVRGRRRLAGAEVERARQQRAQREWPVRRRVQRDAHQRRVAHLRAAGAGIRRGSVTAAPGVPAQATPVGTSRRNVPPAPQRLSPRPGCMRPARLTPTPNSGGASALIRAGRAGGGRARAGCTSAGTPPAWPAARRSCPAG